MPLLTLPASDDYDFLRLRPLIGYKISGLVRSRKNEFGEEFLGLKLSKLGQTDKVIYFEADDEGNGPGSFSIEDYNPS